MIGSLCVVGFQSKKCVKILDRLTRVESRGLMQNLGLIKI